MSRTDDILETYLAAGSDEIRLHIYLQHPSLRGEFIRIDLAKKPAPAKIKKFRNEPPDKPFRSRWRAAVDNCCLKFRF